MEWLPNAWPWISAGALSLISGGIWQRHRIQRLFDLLANEIDKQALAADNRALRRALKMCLDRESLCYGESSSGRTDDNMATSASEPNVSPPIR